MALTDAARGAIGRSRKRIDGEAKVRGATRYVADLPVPGLLHARPVLAVDAHARILAIDADAAREVPGVVAVLTAADLPLAPGASGRTGEPLAREEIVFAGQPVALVVAESEAAAMDGAGLVTVETEPLPAVLDLESALAPGSALVRLSGGGEGSSDIGEAHATVGSGEQTAAEKQSENVAGSHRLAHADAAAALAASDATADGRITTSWIHQGYIEPQAATAWLEPEGELVISASTQGAFATRDAIAALLGLPLERVRVRPAPLGGAFGGKLVIVEPLAAAAAMALRRPVRLVFTRMEDLAAANPAPGQLMELEAGARADGRLTGVRGRVIVDRGALSDFGIETISALLATGPYRWEAFDLGAYGVLTNRVGFGSYRAPGAPPAAFAIETLLDELAEQLGLDPVELRLRNVLVEGDPGPDGQPTPVFGARDCLERVRDSALWARRGELPDGEGIGMAIGYWPGGLEPAAAACRLDSDGRLTVVTGAVDMSGTETVFATIAAEAFGLEPEDVRVVASDTSSSAAYAGISGGSKVTYTVGRAIERAALQARERLLNVAAAELEIATEDLEIVGGEVRPAGSPAQAISIKELAGRVLRFGGRHEPIEGHAGVAQTSRAPSAAAHVSHVRVDRETGAVTLLDHLVVQDVGKALNPALVAGQMLGGTVQGFGWALFEALVHDEAGQLRTGSLVDYAMPSAGGIPPVELEIVEVPAPDGPYGAKGIGEAPVVAVAAAVANAIHDAAGVRMRELPITPEKVWRALQAVG
jgi:CO/xanthine dehydrogenase Mo-binding subunit